MDNETIALKKENACLRESLTNQRVDDVTRRVDAVESRVTNIESDIREIKDFEAKIYTEMTSFTVKYKYIVFKWFVGVLLLLACSFVTLYIAQGRSISSAKDEIIKTLIDERMKSVDKVQDKFK